MIVFQIFANEIRQKIKSILIYSLIIGGFVVLLAYLYDPVMFGDIDEMFANYPDELLLMFGGDVNLATLDGFMHLEIFAFSWLWFGIYLILHSARDIPSDIENKTIELTLSKPINRWEYIAGKALSHFISAACVIFTSLLGLVIYLPNEPRFEGVFNLGNIAIAFVWLFVFMFALMASALLISTTFSSGKSVGLAFGFLVFMFFFGTYWGILDESLENIKYFSLFYYFDTSSILNMGELGNFWPHTGVLLGYSLIMILCTILVFNNRDIPIK